MTPQRFSSVEGMPIGARVICLQEGSTYGKTATVIEHRTVFTADFWDPWLSHRTLYAILKWEDGCDFATQIRHAFNFIPYDEATHLSILDKQKRDAYAEQYL